MDIRAKMQEYRVSQVTDPLDLHGSDIDWRAFGSSRGMTQAELETIAEATLEYNKNVRDPNRPGLQRLEIVLKSDDTIFRLYPGADDDDDVDDDDDDDDDD